MNQNDAALILLTQRLLQQGRLVLLFSGLIAVLVVHHCSGWWWLLLLVNLLINLYLFIRVDLDAGLFADLGHGRFNLVSLNQALIDLGLSQRQTVPKLLDASRGALKWLQFLVLAVVAQSIWSLGLLL